MEDTKIYTCAACHRKAVGELPDGWEVSENGKSHLCAKCVARGIVTVRRSPRMNRKQRRAIRARMMRGEA